MGFRSVLVINVNTVRMNSLLDLRRICFMFHNFYFSQGNKTVGFLLLC